MRRLLLVHVAALAIVAISISARAEPYLDAVAHAATRLDQEADRISAASYRALPPIGPGPVLDLGADGARVGRLAARLSELGFLPTPSADPAVYDDGVAAAVRAFQMEQGLDADGLAGPGTVAALDRDASSRIRALRLTAARMRAFLAKESGDEFIVVNVPAASVSAVKNGAVALAMRAVVGRADRPTPLIDDVATDVVLDPVWTVPASIVRKEEMPVIRKTGWTDVPDAKVYVDGAEAAQGSVDWSTIAPRQVRIVQQPGPENALGLYKLELTNDDGVYLHGTDDPGLFTKDARFFSHGCIRMQAPRQMVDLLLEGAGWPDERIDKTLAAGKPFWIPLPRKVPVHVVYWTAGVAADGRIVYNPDVYGYDAASMPAIGTPALRADR